MEVVTLITVEVIALVAFMGRCISTDMREAAREGRTVYGYRHILRRK